MFDTFSIARLPRIEFGTGVFSRLSDICLLYGQNVLLVTGACSFTNSSAYQQLVLDFKNRQINFLHCIVENEPSPQLVDEAVRQYSPQAIDVVLAIGGGSALDAGKAIAGLLKVRRSVMDYLEGVGPELQYQGPAVPLVAVPTTAGTGSEATKNAVLSVQGMDGFKKSFRDDQLVAEYAVVDPALLGTCPKSVIAANGMDALTQLLESYVSTKSNPLTDALAISGLRSIRDSLLPFYSGQGDTRRAQEHMAYASLLSGICLAQTGLGSVHGLASPLGAFFPIPHGVVCGTLVAKATEINIEAMLAREPDNPALAKYARMGDVLCEKRHRSPTESRQRLCELLGDWCDRLELQGLSDYGLEQDKLDHVVAHSRGSSMKTNPIELTDEELKNLLIARL